MTTLTTSKRILLATTCFMADPTDAPAGAAIETIEDPLSAAAGGIEERKFPCLAADRIYRTKIVSSVVGPTKNDATREALTITIQTELDYTDTEGKPLRAGYKGFIIIGVSPSEERIENGKTIRARTMKDIAQDLAMPLKATGKTSVSPRELLANPSQLEGEVVDVKAGYQKESGGFPAKNTFKFVLPG